MKKVIILVSIMTLIIISLSISNNLNKEYIKYDKNTLLAVAVNGEEGTSLPQRGDYSVEVSCIGGTGRWDYDTWELVITNVSATTTCDISFTDVIRTNLASYIKSLSLGTVGEVAWSLSTGTEQTITAGDSAGKAVGTGYTIDNSGLFRLTEVQTGVTFNSGHETMYTCGSSANIPNNTGIKCSYLMKINSVSGSTNVTSYTAVGTPSGTQSNAQGVWYENGYRYEGENPNNWIVFNGEMWRIIGVFDSTSHGVSGQWLTKIIRADSIGGLAWHKSNTNDWNASSLKALLNGDYYEGKNNNGTIANNTATNCYMYSTSVNGNCDFRRNGITNEVYRGMIENVTWYLGGWNAAVSTNSFYGYERGETVYSGRPTSGTGYIGLMYASDYGYSVLGSSCGRSTSIGSYGSAACSGKAWLRGTGYEWTLTPNSNYSNGVWSVLDNGNLVSNNASFGCAVRPVLYLRSDVQMLSGDGSISNPYIIVR